MEHRYELAIIKGLVEQADETYHFGSLLGFEAHLASAIRLGWIDDQRRVTDAGRAVYRERAESLPNTRAAWWAP